MPGEDREGAAAKRHEVRYFHDEDKEVAEQLADDTTQALRKLEYSEKAFSYPAPPNWPGKSYLVSALGHLGLETETKRALEELLQLKPDLTLGWFRSQPYFVNMGRDVMGDYLDGLRKAGLPE